MSERGGCEFRSNLPAVLSMIDRVGRERVEAAAIIARNSVVEGFSGTRTGREYYRPPPARGQKYTASAIGERPAKPTGILAGAVRWAVEAPRTEFIGWVGIPGRAGAVSLSFGVALELKSPAHGGRPWLVPGVKAVQSQIYAVLGKRWE